MVTAPPLVPPHAPLAFLLHAEPSAWVEGCSGAETAVGEAPWPQGARRRGGRFGGGCGVGIFAVDVCLVCPADGGAAWPVSGASSGGVAVFWK